MNLDGNKCFKLENKNSMYVYECKDDEKILFLN